MHLLLRELGHSNHVDHQGHRAWVDDRGTQGLARCSRTQGHHLHAILDIGKPGTMGNTRETWENLGTYRENIGKSPGTDREIGNTYGIIANTWGHTVDA